jgi:WD40 repeat protein
MSAVLTYLEISEKMKAFALGRYLIFVYLYPFMFEGCTIVCHSYFSKCRKRTASECMVMRGHSGPVYGLTYTRDSSHVLSTSEDKTIRLWNLTTFTNQVAYQGHNYPVWDITMRYFL